MNLEIANMSDNQDMLVRLSGAHLDDNRLARVRADYARFENFLGLGKTRGFL